MKRIAFVILITTALLMAFAGVAYANYGPHGGYSPDTDACAGCHRAHTSFSQAQWQDSNGTLSSGLLVGSATTIQMFCYTCHGNSAPGASTNVEYGLFDAGPSSGDGSGGGVASPAGSYAYTTKSSFDATLNGGGFQFVPTAPDGSTFAQVSSTHAMSEGTTGQPVATQMTVWGFGNAASDSQGSLTQFTCTNCHDPHGSSNYRLLKDSVDVGGGSVPVGGYSGAAPTPYVVSNEQGYPAGGWLKAAAGETQMSGYHPDYTDAQYAYTALPKGISGWCSGCHTQYDKTASTYDYGAALGDKTYSGGGTGAQVGALTYHRHPVGVPIDAGPSGTGHLTVDTKIDQTLPLERPAASGPASWTAWSTSDVMGCLTCHRAHGTAATMQGWAQSELVINGLSNQGNASATETNTPEWQVKLIGNGAANKTGVNPTFSSALLRQPNRGVCERCHNK